VAADSRAGSVAPGSEFAKHGCPATGPSQHEDPSQAAYRHMVNGEKEMAVPLLNQVLQAKPNDVWALYNLGSLLTDLSKDLQGAELLYIRALKVDPHHVPTMFNFAAILHTSDRTAEAERLYRRILEGQPNHINALSNLGALLWDRRDSDEAEAILRRAISLEPAFPKPIANLANLLRVERQDWESAEALYRRALQLEPGDVQTLANLGALLRTVRDDNVEAEPLLRRALDLDPKNVSALTTLGGLMLDHHSDIEAAQALNDRALAIAPNDTYALYNRGVLLESFTPPDRKGAEEAFRAALKIDPTNRNAKAALETLMNVDPGTSTDGR